MAVRSTTLASAHSPHTQPSQPHLARARATTLQHTAPPSTGCAPRGRTSQEIVAVALCTTTPSLPKVGRLAHALHSPSPDDHRVVQCCCPGRRRPHHRRTSRRRPSRCCRLIAQATLEPEPPLPEPLPAESPASRVATAQVAAGRAAAGRVGLSPRAPPSELPPPESPLPEPPKSVGDARRGAGTVHMW